MCQMCHIFVSILVYCIFICVGLTITVFALIMQQLIYVTAVLEGVQRNSIEWQISHAICDFLAHSIAIWLLFRQQGQPRMQEQITIAIEPPCDNSRTAVLTLALALALKHLCHSKQPKKSHKKYPPTTPIQKVIYTHITNLTHWIRVSVSAPL